ncbi:MAG TPA: hypothetical protein VKU87_03060 [Thermomicrobiaceae bacterium]|nr:hypothetical protein [Thermomicrobiaceae bacterium]
MIERAFAWLRGYRHLQFRYDRRDTHYQAFLSLACAVICFHRLETF